MCKRRLWLPIALGALSLVAAQPASAETFTFGFTGAEQTYNVPAGVHSIHVVAVGAKGGKGSSDTFGFFHGGKGAVGERVEADLSVAAGEVLFIEVGGAGGDASLGGSGIGGFNGGGTSTSAVPGGGGGGSTDLRTCSATAVLCPGGVGSLASRLLVAAGGGGGGGFGNRDQAFGGEGGSEGSSGVSGETSGCAPGETSGGGGRGGTQLAGGQGGIAGNTGGFAGQSGRFGVGGDATDPMLNSVAGGGGGGGYFGGGAGGTSHNCSGGGGGGGSTFAAASATNVTQELNSEPSGVVITAPDVAPPQEPPPPGPPSQGPPAGERKPSNAFTLGTLTRNRQRGTAVLVATLPGPGALVLGGRGIVKKQRTARAGGKVKLPIQALGTARRSLSRIGKAKVTARITFRPTGGDANTKVRKCTLVKAAP
jgi:hypothetical protein